MIWSDAIAILLIIVIAWVESHRGFGRAIFDLLGGIISLKVADALSHPLAAGVPVFAGSASNQAFWFAAGFVILAALTLLASKYIHETTMLSLDVLDPLVGAFFGIASGMVVSHIFMKTLLLGYGDGPDADVLLASLMGQELLKFRTYHAIVTALQNLGNW